MTWPIQHFTADDLDAFHSASLSAEATRHLEECAECRVLVERDRALLEALETLPGFGPGEGFADRVMTRVTLPVPGLARIRRPRRLAFAASVLVGLGASIGWSLLNQPLLASWIDGLADGIGRAVWVGVATVAQNLSEQPWVSGLFRFGPSSGQLPILGGAVVIGYLAAMIALRRLLVLPVPASRTG